MSQAELWGKKEKSGIPREMGGWGQDCRGRTRGEEEGSTFGGNLSAPLRCLTKMLFVYWEKSSDLLRINEWMMLECQTPWNISITSALKDHIPHSFLQLRILLETPVLPSLQSFWQIQFALRSGELINFLLAQTTNSCTKCWCVVLHIGIDKSYFCMFELRHVWYAGRYVQVVCACWISGTQMWNLL